MIAWAGSIYGTGTNYDQTGNVILRGHAAATLDALAKFNREERIAAVRAENKEMFTRFASRKAGLPYMFRKWYR